MLPGVPHPHPCIPHAQGGIACSQACIPHAQGSITYHPAGLADSVRRSLCCSLTSQPSLKLRGCSQPPCSYPGASWKVRGVHGGSHSCLPSRGVLGAGRGPVHPGPWVPANPNKRSRHNGRAEAPARPQRKGGGGHPNLHPTPFCSPLSRGEHTQSSPNSQRGSAVAGHTGAYVGQTPSPDPSPELL